MRHRWKEGHEGFSRRPFNRGVVLVLVETTKDGQNSLAKEVEGR